MGPKLTIHEVDFNQVPFLIQLHGVPLENLSEKNSRIIGRKMGEIIFVLKTLLQTTVFCRISYEFEVTKEYYIESLTDEEGIS